jgi:predicted nucleotidyltransferase
MLTDPDIQRIAARIVDGCAPLVVGTFGSYAVGMAKPRSDLDLFVVARSREHPSASRRAVARLLFGVLHPIDLHVFTPDAFEEAAHEELSFEWIIVRQARIYHWSSEAALAVPSLAARAPREQPGAG